MVLMEYGNRFYLLSFRPYALAIGALALFGMMPRSKTDIREYCFPNAFNISCGKDEVIVITSARYGRMNKGFCLTSDYHVGCWADVLYHVDRKCSGRHQCVISIPDTILHQIQPCPKDMLAYLESEYVCQRVQTRAPFPCKHLGDLVVTEKSGFLANIVTEEQGFGSNRCPWVISASKGRRINITLVDFAVATRYPEARNTCHVYASLRESDSASEVTVCGGRSRERSVFVSESSRVEITVMNFKFKNEPIYFLLKYEAIGCSDPKVPRGAFLQRDGVQATVRCNFTSQSWHIVCQGDTWFGSIDNCTVETQTAKSSIVFTETSDMYPIGLLIAVMVGLILGVLIGVFLLTLVLSCHKRYYANRRLRDAKELSQRVIYGTRRDPSSILDDGTSTYCTSASTGRGRFPEHEGYRYTHVCGVGTVASCQHQMSPG